MAEVENEVSEFPNSVILMKNCNPFSSLVPFPPSLKGKRTLLEMIFFLTCFFASTVWPSGLTKKMHFHIQSRVGRFPLSDLQFTLFAFVFQDSGQVIPLIVESCIRFINLYGKL